MTDQKLLPAKPRTLTPPIWAPWMWPFGAHSVLVVPPAVEPIDLARAKLLAGLDWPDTDEPRNAMMQGFIAAARSKVEQDTGLALLTQTRDLYFASSAIATYGYVPLANQVVPVQSIEDTATVHGGGRRARPLGSTFFAVHDAALVPREAFPADYGVARLVVGWLDPMELAAAAPLLTWAVGALTAHYATLGRDIASIDLTSAVPFGYEEAIGPHRLIWLA